MASSFTNHPTGEAADHDWTGHEHVTENVRHQAQKLIDEIGSVDLAKQAVEAVGDVTTLANEATQQEGQVRLANSLGFNTVEELWQASSSVPANDGKNWYITKVGDSSWAVWNDQQFQAERHFSDRDEALASVPHEDQFTGTSLLG